MGMSQMAVCRRIIDEVEADGHDFDLTPLDLLDYMGIVGVQFVEGAKASDEYVEAVREMADAVHDPR